MNLTELHDDRSVYKSFNTFLYTTSEQYSGVKNTTYNIRKKVIKYQEIDQMKDQSIHYKLQKHITGN